MTKLTFGSLFAGIGGFDLGFERAGLTCSWQVEIDDYCRRVLAKHWPHVRRWDDVCTFPPEPVDNWRVDVLCGGFPCQDISDAGKRIGITGERSGLWSEFSRIIRRLRPRFVVVENVEALLRRGMGTVLGDLAEIGFDAEWEVLPAEAFGAPHPRRRAFLVAYPGGVPLRGGFVFQRSDGISSDPIWRSAKDIKQWRQWKCWLNSTCVAGDGDVSAADFRRMDDGIPKGMERWNGIGNAVVPQVAEWIGRQIVNAAN